MARIFRISLVAVLLAAVSTPAWGQSARRGAVIGGLGGAAVGGIIGSGQRRGGRGALIGGAIGAAAGAAIGSARQQRYYGPPAYYHVPPRGVHRGYGVPAQPYYPAYPRSYYRAYPHPYAW